MTDCFVLVLRGLACSSRTVSQGGYWKIESDCFKNINTEAFVNSLVKPLYRGRAAYENPKAPLLKKDYFYGVSPFSDYIVHGTVP